MLNAKRNASVFVHVGLHKTGSTFLQHRVFPYLKKAKMDKKSKGLDKANAVSETEKEFFESFLPQNKFSFINNLGLRSLLISEESLSGNILFHYDHSESIPKRLKESLPNGKIILIIRRQVDLVDSLYRQVVLMGYPSSTNTYLNYRNGRFTNPIYSGNLKICGIDVRKQDWFSLVENYHKYFGKENILVIPYELLADDQNYFLGMIFEFFGTNGYYPKNKEVINRSFSFLSVNIASILNRFLVREYNKLGLIVEQPFLKIFEKGKKKLPVLGIAAEISRRMSLRYILKQLDKVVYINKSVIGERKRRLIKEMHKRSNRKLDEKLQLGLKRFGYY